MGEQLPLWSVLMLPLLLGGLALAAASADSAVAALAAGRRVTLAELATPVRESTRLLVTQRRTTVASDTVLWRLGAGGVIVVALLASLVVPLGDRPVLDPPAGIVWFNAMEVLLWVLVWMAGWGANSAYSLVGGYRYLAQGLAYELPLMLALITAGLGAGSLRVVDVVAAQQDRWFVLDMPVAFIVYLAGVVGFSFWGPLSSAVAADLGGGVRAELSGVDRLVFLAGRYFALAVGAAFAVPLFLGGSAGPVLPGVVWSAVKTLGVLAALVWVRWRLPLIRPDRYVEVAWVVLIPLILAQTLVTSVLVLAGE
jgi:NADH-quinone oxidoreductase subunit H